MDVRRGIFWQGPLTDHLSPLIRDPARLSTAKEGAEPIGHKRVAHLVDLTSVRCERCFKTRCPVSAHAAQGGCNLTPRGRAMKQVQRAGRWASLVGLVLGFWTCGAAVAQEGVQPDTRIPLVVVLWQNVNFGGSKREGTALPCPQLCPNQPAHRGS